MQELISLSIGTLDFCGGLEVYGVALRVITIWSLEFFFTRDIG